MRKSRSVVLENKAHALNTIIGGYQSMGVAFSGGVDSTLLLAAAKKVLGDRVVAFTAVSDIHARGEKELAIDMAREMGVRHVMISTHELDDPDFVGNSVDRCYHCKRRLFLSMQEQAASLGIIVIAHGANLDDVSDVRPGFRAARELSVAAPLIDAGLNKADIRQLARQWGLSNWDRPSMACLATRVPYGTMIHLEMLRQIDRAETMLRNLGVGQCRVRHYGDMARIESDAAWIERMASPPLRRQIVEGLQALGYQHICLDLEGYLSGKMNRGNDPPDGL